MLSFLPEYYAVVLDKRELYAFACIFEFPRVRERYAPVS
jgi:hypothetical protein